MKNKFLIGARFASVMLALLLGVGSAWAAVTVDLADLKFDNTTTAQPAPSGAANPASGAHTFFVWPKPKDENNTDNKDVRAKFTWTTGIAASAARCGNNVTACYDSVLVLEVGNMVDTVIVKGVAPKSGKYPRITKIEFAGGKPTNATLVEWDGGDVKGVLNDANARSVDAFLTRATTNDIAGIHIIDGKIEAASQYILKDVGGVKYNGATGPATSTAYLAKNLVGHWNVTAATGKSITLISHGLKAAIHLSTGDGGLLGDDATPVDEILSINPPANGTYTITSSYLALERGVSGTPANDHIVIGRSNAAGKGKIVINAQDTVKNAAEAASAGAAFEATNIRLGGTDLSATDKGVVVKSKGKYVLVATTNIDATSAEIHHAAATKTAGAVAVWAKNGTVDLKKVVMTNGAKTGYLPGLVASASSNIDITEGSYMGSEGGSAVISDATITIKGTKIWSGNPATKAGSVVKANKVVLETTEMFPAEIAWSGSGNFSVDAIDAKEVEVKTIYNQEASVNVTGTGHAINVQTPAPGTAKRVVLLEGNNKKSVVIAVASGQAIRVANAFGGAQAGVVIADANIKRTGTGTAPLVGVVGGDVLVWGTSLERMTMSAGTGVAISAEQTTATTPLGGKIRVDGGVIAGATGALSGYEVKVMNWIGAATSPTAYTYGATPTDAPGTQNTVITSTSGITVYSNATAVVNNGFATVENKSTAADDPSKNVSSSAIFSLKGAVNVHNVDSVKAAGGTALMTANPGQGVVVLGGKIKSGTSYAINSVGNVVIDWARGVTSGSPAAPSALIDGQRHYKIEVSTNSTSPTVSAIYAPYTAASTYYVDIGEATVSSTGASGGAAAINVTKGTVVIQHKDARIVSQSGTGVKVSDANVVLAAGDIVSNPGSGNYAGIWVTNGNVDVGSVATNGTINLQTGVITNTSPTWDPPIDTRNRSSVSSNGALAVWLDGLGDKVVNVGYFGMLSVKGTGATAGMIKVTKKNQVVVQPNATLISTGSQAFAIEAEEGDVHIDGGNIVSVASKQAISTSGGNIYIGGNNTNATTLAAHPILAKAGSAYRHIDGGKDGVRITGNEGTLVRSIKNKTTGRAGEIVVHGGFIYNKYGTGIRADDTLRIFGGEIVTDKDTAVTAGLANAVGLIEIAQIVPLGGTNPIPAPHIWAAGDYAKVNPVAVTARMIRINGGVIEANTIKSSADNTSTYPDNKATGILLKKGPGTPVFKIGVGEWNSPAGVTPPTLYPTTVIAHGASTAIDCQDSAVTLDIKALSSALHVENFRISVNGDNLGEELLTMPGTISVKAGENGIAIKSVGEIRISGEENVSGTSTGYINEESKEEGKGLQVPVYIATGNGPQARAIIMPVPANAIKHKDLTLHNGFVEAGSDGAVAIDADAKAIVRLDHSVVLVRHLSTAINGKGGVYIDAGYVEVLATENSQVGTAVTGRNIRISGGQGEDDDIEKSEIHSKGIAVKDNVEGAVVQVTGRIHMSGTVASNMKIGASVVTDTGIVTMGSEKSRNLWRLSTVSDMTVELEKGKSLIIPLGVTVEVGDNGSRLATEKFDTVKVHGVVTTVGRQAGAEFINAGRVLVEKGGNVKFNKGTAKSFQNNDGIIVLKTGALLDDSVLVHDTGIVNERKAYTFLKWAKFLSGDTVDAKVGTRGPGRVVVPPMYATLYGNQKLYVDEEDIAEDESDYWTAESKRVDSVYTAKFVKYPLDRRYKPYFETEDFAAEGDFTLGGQGTVKVDEDGTVMLTAAGTFQRIALMKNEAGEGTKVYTHVVEKVDLNRIIANQTEGPIFFDGFFYNKNRRVVGHDGEDTVLVREGGVEVKYTGNTAQLLDGIKGAEIEGYTDISTDKSIYFAGWGTPTYWYRGVGETFYPLTSSVPMNKGQYEILASFAEGNNFVAVPSEPKSIVTIGVVDVVEGDLMSVFNQKDNESYQLVVDLEAKVAKSGVKVTLPSVLRFGAKYDNESLEPSGPAFEAGALVGNATIPDSILTFSVNSNTAVGQFIEFKVTILNTADPPNLTDGNYITVRARFLSKEDMKEIKPTYITVDYRNVKLNGLLVGTTYTINGETLVATSSDTTIKEDWIGKTITVVAQPGVGSYKTASDVANIVIGPRQLVTDSLKAVKGENAKTNISVDGRLTGTSKSMEYKLASDTIWTPATAVVTNGLKAGTYDVRLAPTASAFPSESVSVAVGFDTEVKVLESDREIPNKSVVKEVAVAPVAKVTASFTAGPSPVSKNAGSVKFFSSKQVKSGTLYVFDATGKSVAKIKAKSNGREIGAWNLRDKKGAVVAEGSYVVKGKIVGKDGTKENVSTLFSVVK